MVEIGARRECAERANFLVDRDAEAIAPGNQPWQLQGLIHSVYQAIPRDIEDDLVIFSVSIADLTAEHDIPRDENLALELETLACSLRAVADDLAWRTLRGALGLALRVVTVLGESDRVYP